MSESKCNTTRKTILRGQTIFYCGKGWYFWNPTQLRWEWDYQNQHKDGLRKWFDDSKVD